MTTPKPPRSLWRPRKSTGRWGDDTDIGTKMARKCIAEMKKDGFSPLLGWIVRDMIAAGQFGGIECGFIGTIAEAALRGTRL